MTRVCTRCKKEKPIEDFPRGVDRKGYRARCKLCKYEVYNEYCKRVGYHKARYQKIKESERWRHISKKYGITSAQYSELFKNQNGRCAVCKEIYSHGKPLCVDHNHKTGQVRGLLCTACNQMIGHAHDSEEVLRMAALYLKHSPASSISNHPGDS